MPARLALTKAQRDSLLVLPDTEEAFVRHYSFRWPVGGRGNVLVLSEIQICVPMMH